VRAPGTTSCMRFKQRMNVDFPQPEGPMTAVTFRSTSGSVMLFRARLLPNHAERPSARIFSGPRGGGGVLRDRLMLPSARGALAVLRR
jgi:hypothetical protein